MGETRLVKVLVLASVSSFAGRERIAGVFHYARTHGGWEIQLVNESEAALRLGRFDYAEADGVIRSSTMPLPTGLRLKPDSTVLIVNDCQRVDPKWSTVSNDNEAFAETCAAHLLARKCLSYAYFRYGASAWAVERERAFVHAMRKRGIQPFLFEPHPEADWRDENQAISAWLHSLPKPCGVMAGYDGWAQILLDMARAQGIKVPNDLCVVGVDNDPSVCELTIPLLSSLDPQFRKEGYLAAGLLDLLMRRRNDKAKRGARPLHAVNRGGEIVERASSAFCSRTHICAVRAREIIHIHAASELNVLDVAQKVGASRRLLELRFRECFGHSVNREIQLARVEVMIRYLRNTTFSIAEVCAMSGFSSINYAAKMFKSVTGKTMSDFRKGVDLG